MKTADWIQLGSLIVILLTLVVLAYQVFLQNQSAKAQLLHDRFEMYWGTYEPVTDNQVKEFHLNPEDYVQHDRYEAFYKKKENDAAVRKCILMAQRYEYLAFLHTLRRMGIADPMGDHWLNKWVTDLLDSREFRDVHDYYRNYYPAFASAVDALTKSKDGVVCA